MRGQSGRGGTGRDRRWVIQKTGTGRWEVWTFQTEGARIRVWCADQFPSGAEAIAAFARGER